MRNNINRNFSSNLFYGYLGFVFLAILFLSISFLMKSESKEQKLIGGCEGTRWGCCEDGETSKVDAVGSNCIGGSVIGGCAGTRYGCCPDGSTSKVDPYGSNCNLK